MLDKIMSLDLSNLIPIMIFFILNVGLLCLYLFCAFIAETADTTRLSEHDERMYKRILLIVCVVATVFVIGCDYEIITELGII